MNKPKERILLTPEQSEELVEDLKHHLKVSTAENERLRAQLAQTRYWLLRNQEGERAQLARSLHGGTIQELSSLLFEISTLERLIDDESCSAIVASIRDHLKESIQGLRKVINTMHPPALVHFGLQPAIRSYIEQTQAQYPDLKIALVLNSEERLSDREVEWTLYRVLQQIVQNVVNHAQAHNLMIRLYITEREVRLEAEDDGVGLQLPIREEELLAQDQMGLFSARMLVESFDGFLEIHSTPGKGALVRAIVPQKGDW